VTQRLHPDQEIEELVRRLNESARAAEQEPAAESTSPSARREPAPDARWALPPRNDEGEVWLRDLLAAARRKHASDLLVAAGAPPAVRINGQLEPLRNRALSRGATEMLAAALIPPGRRDDAATRGSADFSFHEEGRGRFRCNVHRERDGWAAAIRLLPDLPGDLESLGLPPQLERLADARYGLVLATGPAGSGKSTTLAALVRRILERRRVHLITVEDPVEYEHEHSLGIVEHIEIGRDVPSFSTALRSILRQDPDVILVGEMRDPESIAIAITAAETGHLVLSSLHTGDSPQTIHRILDSYPAGQQETVRAQLSVALAGIVSQQLVPRRDDHGRVPAVEVLIGTPAVRNLIRRGKIEQIRSQLTLERAAGMLDLDRSLARLVRDGRIDPGEAATRARVPEEFDFLLAGPD